MIKKLKNKETKEIETTYDKFLKTLNKKEKVEFDKEYQQLLLSEKIIASMQKNKISMNKIAKDTGLSPKTIQRIKTGQKTDITMDTFFKIMSALGYTVSIKKNEDQFSINTFI